MSDATVIERIVLASMDLGKSEAAEPDIWTMQVSRKPEHGAFDAFMRPTPRHAPKTEPDDGSREIPAPSIPSTMAELRRLGERTRIRLDGEGPRYDFDEVP